MPQAPASPATLLKPAPPSGKAKRKKAKTTNPPKLKGKPSSVKIAAPCARKGALTVDMIRVAREYFLITGRHLPIYHEIARRYAADKFEIRLHDRPTPHDTDGCTENSHVAVRCIGPKRENSAVVKKSSNFSALVIVKIDSDFSITARWIKRSDLPEPGKNYYIVSWKEAIGCPGISVAGILDKNKMGQIPQDLPGAALKHSASHPPAWLYRHVLRIAREFLIHSPSRSLPLFGALGEIYAASKLGVILHRDPTVPGSDGRRGKEIVEIKTIGPKDGGRDGRVKVKRSGNFSILLIVMVDENFCIHSKMIPRKKLPPAVDGIFHVPWKDVICEYPSLPG